MCATTAPSALKMMASLNGWSVVYLVALIPFQAYPFYQFVGKYPTVMVYLAGLALTGTIGQVFIFLMISIFGTLPCAITTTVRKVFSTVFSVLYKNNKAFSALNWSGVALVFGAFFVDILYRKKFPE
jgi:solute carrier family 35 (UDP-galactose transporter), member B1